MVNTSIIRPIQKKDSMIVGSLHIQNLPSIYGDCKYSRNLLKLFYESFVNSEINISFVADLNGTIIGYICIVKSLNELYIKMIKSYCLSILINYTGLIFDQKRSLLEDVFNRGKTLVKNISRGMHVKKQVHHSGMRESQLYELRPIIVRHDYHGSGLASALIAKVEVSLKERKEERYFLRVYKDNLRAISFYRKVGFIETGSEGSETLVMEKILR